MVVVYGVVFGLDSEMLNLASVDWIKKAWLVEIEEGAWRSTFYPRMCLTGPRSSGMYLVESCRFVILTRFRLLDTTRKSSMVMKNRIKSRVDA